MTTSISILALIGFCISAYAFYAHRRLDAEANYQAVCDLSNRISCTKTFKSDYGKFGGIPIGFYGMVFYVLVAILNASWYFNTLVILSIVSALISGVLAYILYFKVKNVCLVCNSIYLINILLLVFSILQL